MRDVANGSLAARHAAVGSEEQISPREPMNLALEMSEVLGLHNYNSLTKEQ
jgi:hypothetical protein